MCRVEFLLLSSRPNGAWSYNGTQWKCLNIFAKAYDESVYKPVVCDSTNKSRDATWTNENFPNFKTTGVIWHSYYRMNGDIHIFPETHLISGNFPEKWHLCYRGKGGQNNNHQYILQIFWFSLSMCVYKQNNPSPPSKIKDRPCKLFIPFGFFPFLLMKTFPFIFLFCFSFFFPTSSSNL